MGRPVKQAKVHTDVRVSVDRLFEASKNLCRAHEKNDEEEKVKWGDLFDIRNTTLEEAINRLKKELQKEFKFTYYDKNDKLRTIKVKRK